MIYKIYAVRIKDRVETFQRAYNAVNYLVSETKGLTVIMPDGSMMPLIYQNAYLLAETLKDTASLPFDSLDVSAYIVNLHVANPWTFSEGQPG